MEIVTPGYFWQILATILGILFLAIVGFFCSRWVSRIEAHQTNTDDKFEKLLLQITVMATVQAAHTKALEVNEQDIKDNRKLAQELIHTLIFIRTGNPKDFDNPTIKRLFEDK